MKHRLLYNQRSPLVVREENAATTHGSFLFSLPLKISIGKGEGAG